MYLFPFQDLYTGLTNQTFKTKYTSQHKIGGFLPVSLLSVQSHILCRIKKNEYKIFFCRNTVSNVPALWPSPVVLNQEKIPCICHHSHTCKHYITLHYNTLKYNPLYLPIQYSCTCKHSHSHSLYLLSPHLQGRRIKRGVL